MLSTLFVGLGLGIFAAALLLIVARDVSRNRHWKR